MSNFSSVDARTSTGEEMDKWSKSVAIVTGANCGNGFGIMKKLAEAGVTVVGFDISTATIDKFKADNPKFKVHSHVCDVTDEQVVEASFKWVEDTFGGVDILINNAGCMKTVGILEHQKPFSELKFNIDLNFTAVVRCARLAYKSMETRKAYGYIVNINSIYGQGLPFMPEGIQIGVYPGTKYAITATTEILRQELVRLGNRKVRVTSVSPGVVDTNIFLAGGVPSATTKSLLESPYLTPADIGDQIVYLLSTPYHVSIHEITVRATGSEM